MATPKLSHMSKELKSHFRRELGNLEHGQMKRDQDTDRMKSAILNHGYPLTAGGDQLTQTLTSHMHASQTLEVNISGQKLCEDYVSERIHGHTSLWALGEKMNNKSSCLETRSLQ